MTPDEMRQAAAVLNSHAYEHLARLGAERERERAAKPANTPLREAARDVLDRWDDGERMDDCMESLREALESLRGVLSQDEVKANSMEEFVSAVIKAWTVSEIPQSYREIDDAVRAYETAAAIRRGEEG